MHSRCLDEDAAGATAVIQSALTLQHYVNETCISTMSWPLWLYAGGVPTTRPYVCCDVVMLRSKTYSPLVVGDSYSSQSITVPHVLRAEEVEVITSRVQ